MIEYSTFVFFLKSCLFIGLFFAWVYASAEIGERAMKANKLRSRWTIGLCVWAVVSFSLLATAMEVST